MSHFAGSYAPEDVEILLRTVRLQPTDVAEKERLIQSGARHYSEMLSEEAAPSDDYVAIYEDALERNGARMAAAVVALARGIADETTGDIALASFVRAGLPVGVLLNRALRCLGRRSRHYGVSIIRDRGLDRAAMETVLSRHGHEAIVFVDGWTGKGAIAGELSRSWPAIGGREPRLAVLSDVGGFAWMAPTQDDWLIPSGILGGTVSGLISRSVLTPAVAADGGYHGCVPLDGLRAHDRSRAFVDRIWRVACRPEVWATAPCRPATRTSRTARAEAVRLTVEGIARRHDVGNLNRIKPGIAEATRAVLRRRPRKVYLASPGAHDLAAIRHLVERDRLDAEIAPGLTGGYQAVTLIERTD